MGAQAVSSAFPFEVCNVLVALWNLNTDLREMTAKYTKQGRPKLHSFFFGFSFLFVCCWFFNRPLHLI